MRWWRKDLKGGGARRRGWEDLKHHRLMCASPGPSSESLVPTVCSSHRPVPLVLKPESGEVSGLGLQGWVWRGRGPGTWGQELPLWVGKQTATKPFLSSECPQARAQGSSASGPVPLTLPDWELNFIPRIL